MTVLVSAGDFKTKCRAVLFDKDGTLIDFKSMWIPWLEYVFKTLLQKYSLDGAAFRSFEKAIGVDLGKRFIDPEGIMASGAMFGVRNAIASCLSCYGIDNEEAKKTFYNVVVRSETDLDWESLSCPVPGLERLLNQLKDNNIKTAVVTADSTRRAQNVLDALDITHYFDAVVGADRVKETKPAPDMALLACDLLNVSPQEAVVVGDNVTDMCMGRDAGAAGSVGVLTGVCGKPQLAPVASTVIVSVAGMKLY